MAQGQRLMWLIRPRSTGRRPLQVWLQIVLVCQLADVVSSLVLDWGVQGVYIDQLAAAGPAPDWDRSHHHTLGGGEYWRTGIDAIVAASRSALGNGAPLLTESNAEPYMNQIAIYLTLVAFDDAFAGPNLRVAPAFPAIYGGYFVGAGRFKKKWLYFVSTHCEVSIPLQTS